MGKTETAPDIGQVTAASPAASLVRGSYETLVLKAPSTNSNPVWLCDASESATTDGFPLDPGEMITISSRVTVDFYVYAASGSDVLCYVGGK